MFTSLCGADFSSCQDSAALRLCFFNGLVILPGITEIIIATTMSMINDTINQSAQGIRRALKIHVNAPLLKPSILGDLLNQ